MITYAEKADIAAKAVKVLDSVKMRRHKGVADRYANQAIKCLLLDKNERRSISQKSGFGWVFNSKASPAVGMVESALDRMKSRLDKPRYTLKGGEWVLKPKANSVIGRMYSRDRHLESLKRLSESQHKALGGGNPYVVGHHNDPTGAPLLGPQTL